MYEYESHACKQRQQTGLQLQSEEGKTPSSYVSFSGSGNPKRHPAAYECGRVDPEERECIRGPHQLVLVREGAPRGSEMKTLDIMAVTSAMVHIREEERGS